jgi:hypothetical protein
VSARGPGESPRSLRLGASQAASSPASANGPDAIRAWDPTPGLAEAARDPTDASGRARQCQAGSPESRGDHVSASRIHALPLHGIGNAVPLDRQMSLPETGENASSLPASVEPRAGLKHILKNSYGKSLQDPGQVRWCRRRSGRRVFWPSLSAMVSQVRI